MSLYVDGISRTEPKRGRWPFKTACHMYADTSEELDTAADRLGLKPQWKQKPLTCHEHYDLTASMRARAISECGAIEVEWRHWPRLTDEKQRKGRC